MTSGVTTIEALVGSDIDGSAGTAVQAYSAAPEAVSVADSPKHIVLFGVIVKSFGSTIIIPPTAAELASESVTETA